MRLCMRKVVCKGEEKGFNEFCPSDWPLVEGLALLGETKANRAAIDRTTTRDNSHTAMRLYTAPKRRIELIFSYALVIEHLSTAVAS